MEAVKLSNGQQELNQQIFADARLMMRSWANAILSRLAYRLAHSDLRAPTGPSSSTSSSRSHVAVSASTGTGGPPAFLRSARIWRM
jgi:hypothetical protein